MTLLVALTVFSYTLPYANACSDQITARNSALDRLSQKVQCSLTDPESCRTLSGFGGVGSLAIGSAALAARGISRSAPQGGGEVDFCPIAPGRGGSTSKINWWELDVLRLRKANAQSPRSACVHFGEQRFNRVRTTAQEVEWDMRQKLDELAKLEQGSVPTSAERLRNWLQESGFNDAEINEMSGRSSREILNQLRLKHNKDLADQLAWRAQRYLQSQNETDRKMREELRDLLMGDRSRLTPDGLRRSLNTLRAPGSGLTSEQRNLISSFVDEIKDFDPPKELSEIGRMPDFSSIERRGPPLSQAELAAIRRERQSLLRALTDVSNVNKTLSRTGREMQEAARNSRASFGRNVQRRLGAINSVPTSPEDMAIDAATQLIEVLNRHTDMVRLLPERSQRSIGAFFSQAQALSRRVGKSALGASLARFAATRAGTAMAAAGAVVAGPGLAAAGTAMTAYEVGSALAGAEQKYADCMSMVLPMSSSNRASVFCSSGNPLSDPAKFALITASPAERLEMVGLNPDLCELISEIDKILQGEQGWSAQCFKDGFELSNSSLGVQITRAGAAAIVMSKQAVNGPVRITHTPDGSEIAKVEAYAPGLWGQANSSSRLRSREGLESILSFQNESVKPMVFAGEEAAKLTDRFSDSPEIKNAIGQHQAASWALEAASACCSDPSNVDPDTCNGLGIEKEEQEQIRQPTSVL